MSFLSSHVIFQSNLSFIFHFISSFFLNQNSSTISLYLISLSHHFFNLSFLNLISIPHQNLIILTAFIDLFSHFFCLISLTNVFNLISPSYLFSFILFLSFYRFNLLSPNLRFLSRDLIYDLILCLISSPSPISSHHLVSLFPLIISSITFHVTNSEINCYAKRAAVALFNEKWALLRCNLFMWHSLWKSWKESGEW